MNNGLSAAVGQERSRMDAVMDEAQETVSFLHESITQLETRLECVLSSREPAPGLNAPTVRNASKQLADRIADRNAAISDATRRIHQLIGRLEL